MVPSKCETRMGTPGTAQRELRDLWPNNGMQQTALRAAADAERWAVELDTIDCDFSEALHCAYGPE